MGLAKNHVLHPRPMNIHGKPPPPIRVPMNVFLSQPCLDQVSQQFPWLVPKPHHTPTDSNLVVPRDVASLKMNVIQHYVPFQAAGLDMTPLPVWHGDDLISLGFSFSVTSTATTSTSTTTNVVYISDISKMIPETLDYILKTLPPTDILIVDSLLPEHPHPVHFNLQQAISLAKQIQPKQHTYLVGMSCDAFPPHDTMNATLAKIKGCNISFAHDGLVVEL